MGRNREPVSELAVAVGARLRIVRLEAGRSQAWVADAIDVTQGSISNYEAGLRDIPVHLLLSALSALGHDPGRFFEGLPGLISATDGDTRSAAEAMRAVPLPAV